MNIPECNSKQCLKCHLILPLDQFLNKKKKQLKSCNTCLENQRHNTNVNKQYTGEYEFEWMQRNKDKYKDDIQELRNQGWNNDLSDIYLHLRAKYDPIPDWKGLD